MNMVAPVSLKMIQNPQSEINSQAIDKISPVKKINSFVTDKTSNDSLVKSAEQLETAFRNIGIRPKIKKVISSEKMGQVGTKEFNQNMFDIAFNACRYLHPQLKDQKLDDWHAQYDKNYNHLEKHLQETMQKKSPEEQKAFLMALRTIRILAPTNPELYRKKLENLLQNKVDIQKFTQETEKELTPFVGMTHHLKMPDPYPFLGFRRLANQKNNRYEDLQDLHNNHLLCTDEYITALNPHANHEDKMQTHRKTNRRLHLMRHAPNPDRPRVLLFWNAREGKVGDHANPNTSYENGVLTDKLKRYWEKKGCDVITIDGSGGSMGRTIDVRHLFKTVQPAGFITGGGPDINPADPFVKNMTNLVKLSEEKDMPYFGECLGHQLIGMIHAGEKDYKNYVGKLNNRAAYSPNDVSELNSDVLEKDFALYKGELRNILQEREQAKANGQKIDPIHVYSIHNNIVNPKKPFENSRIRIDGTAQIESDKGAPEMLVRQNKDGSRRVITTQFHPSEIGFYSSFLSRDPKSKDKMTYKDEQFSLAILNSIIQDVKKYHQEKITFTPK